MIPSLLPVQENGSNEPFVLINQALIEFKRYARIDKAVKKILEQVAEFRDVLYTRDTLPRIVLDQLGPKPGKQLLTFSIGSVQKLEGLARQFFDHYDSSNQIVREYLFKFYELTKERAEGESELGGETQPLPHWFWLESPQAPLETDDELNTVAAAYAFLDEQERRLSEAPHKVETMVPESTPCCDLPFIWLKKIIALNLQGK